MGFGLFPDRRPLRSDAEILVTRPSVAGFIPSNFIPSRSARLSPASQKVPEQAKKEEGVNQSTDQNRSFPLSAESGGWGRPATAKVG
jgi:hypothetical protein